MARVASATTLVSAHALLRSPPLARNWASGMTLPVYGNDVAGDCIEATAYYRLDMLARLRGQTFAGTTTQAFADYRAIAGWDGVPGSSSDTGSSAAALFARYQSAGLACGAKLLAYAPINFADHFELRAAINAFAGVYVTGNLPINLATNAPWDMPANPAANDLPVPGERGHAWLLTGFDDRVLVSARGVQMTSEWVATCLSGAWVLLDEELFVGDVAPSGATRAELLAFIKARS